MCAGALVAARIRRLVFGARDLRFGGVRSKFRIADSDLLNHRVEIVEGVLAAECTETVAGLLPAEAWGERPLPPAGQAVLSNSCSVETGAAMASVAVQLADGTPATPSCRAPWKYSSSGNRPYGSSSRKTRPSFCSMR